MRRFGLLTDPQIVETLRRAHNPGPFIGAQYDHERGTVRINTPRGWVQVPPDVLKDPTFRPKPERRPF